jgi:hypothetical protein
LSNSTRRFLDIEAEVDREEDEEEDEEDEELAGVPAYFVSFLPPQRGFHRFYR